MVFLGVRTLRPTALVCVVVLPGLEQIENDFEILDIVHRVAKRMTQYKSQGRRSLERFFLSISPAKTQSD